MKRKCLSIVVILCILISFAQIPAFAENAVWDGSIASGFESGSGTERDPYIIKTAPQLAYLAKSVNNGTSFSGEYIKLANDIALNSPDMFARDENGNITGAAEGKTPNTWHNVGGTIGGALKFSGTFDGDNHEIKGIYINAGGTSNIGLFSTCVDSTVKNVGITGGYIYGSNSTGGIVGNNSGVVENCYSTGTIIGAYREIGGVVGTNNREGTVINCYNTGMVTGDYISVGGVVGGNGGIIESCYNTGTVAAREQVGGVVGYSNNGTLYGMARVSNCYNTGAVTGGMQVGGIVGYHRLGWSSSNVTEIGTTMVVNCYNTGAVTAAYHSVGGIVGDNNGPIKNDYNTALVSCCYNSGTVTSDQTSVGGIIGCNSGTVKNCYNTATVTGCITYAGEVGGIVGRADVCKIESCYNIGTVMAVRGGAGGIVGGRGIGSNDIFRNCYCLKGCIDIASNDDCGTFLTDTQMREQSSFYGFDFDTVWVLEYNPNYLYPELISFYQGGYVPLNAETKVVKNRNSYRISASKANVGTAKIIVAGYKDNKVFDIKILNNYNQQTTFTGDFDTFKVMVWEDLSTLQPLCDAETIPQSEWIIELE